MAIGRIGECSSVRRGRPCGGAWGQPGAPWPARRGAPSGRGRAAHRAPSAALRDREWIAEETADRVPVGTAWRRRGR